MRLVRISIFLLLLSLPIIGQTNKGGITGTVTDPKGLAVPGATVTITNVGTNTSIVLTTSRQGSFTASTLDPALYDVIVEASNFKKAIVERVKVDTASVTTVNVAVEVGSVSEEVTIQADAQMVNSDSGTISQTITERQLRDLPLNNRSVLDLALTMPNVSGDAGSEDIDAGFSSPSPGFNLSVNGGRPGSTSMLADGVNNTGVGIARSVVSFTPETVQEFSVQSSAYSAEFGTTGGGVINITTKSGANDFFGTALWYHRNPKTNARAWNQGTAPRPANNLRSNQVSLTVGGPIMLPNIGDGGPRIYSGKNRSFFFFAWEPRWRNDFSQGIALVPTEAERSGNFRDLVLTSSGWLPRSVAAQFGQQQVVGADSNIYQRYTIGAGGILVPIIVPPVPVGSPTGTTHQFCPFGWSQAIGIGVSTNPQGQPYCTGLQAATQIENMANNPNLNVIPQEFLDPTALRLMGIMNPPDAGGYFLENGIVRNLSTLREATQNESRFTVRLDHNFTDKMKATFRWTKTPAVGIRASSGSDINGNTGIYSDATQYLVTVNNVLSPNITNEARFNYTQGNFSEDFSPEFSIMGGRNYSTELGLRSLTAGGMPLMTGWGTDTQYAAPDLGSGLSTNNFNVENRYDISDTLYWNRGNMLWKIGGNINRARLQSTPFFAGSGGRWNFRRIATNRSPTGQNNAANGGNTLASFLIGVPASADYRPALFTYNYQWDSYAFFVQNDWKIRPNFSLNLGLRYSLQMPRTEDDNLQGVFRPDLAQSVTLTTAPTVTVDDPATPNINESTQRGNIAIAAGVPVGSPIPDYVPTTAQIVPFAFSGRGGRSKHIVPIDYSGWEPRLGFAWSPKMKIFGFDTEKNSLVIRGGFGISHFPINGNNRGANPDFGGFQAAGTLNPTAVGGAASSGTDNAGQPVRLTGNNPLAGSAAPLDTLLGTDPNGLVWLKAIGVPAVAVDINDPDFGTVPSAQNWNLAVQFAPFRNSTIEIAYVGNRGVHLFTPQININERDVDTIETLLANNINTSGNVADPLGRRDLLGAAIGTQVASLFSTYLGYDPLNKYFNAKSSSIRHAGYIDFRRRMTRGLSLTANYTFAKSLDDSSDASPDVRVLTSGSVKGQVALGGSLEDDWALSAFDTKHAFSSTFTWDLPFGKGRQFFKDAPWYVNGPLGGWVMSGVARIVSGNPFQPFITDPNRLGGDRFNRVVRPDIVAGVPLKNPLWDPSCRVGTSGGATGPVGCEPYVNPAAFMRPVRGQLGNAPRTLSIREPFRKYFDLSIQKDFPMPWIGGEGKRRINFRVDAINLFNMGNFYFNSRGNTPFGFGTFPVEITGENATINGVTFAQPITAVEYNQWAGFNGRPLATVGTTVPGTPEGNAALLAIRQMVNAVRLPPRAGSTSGALPDAFFNIPLPEGFATRNSLAYDITTLEGFKLWRIRNNYDGNFGSLTSGAIAFGSPNPGTSQRYIQFGIRLIF